jgi:hypothetical protein
VTTKIATVTTMNRTRKINIRAINLSSLKFGPSSQSVNLC